MQINSFFRDSIFSYLRKFVIKFFEKDNFVFQTAKFKNFLVLMLQMNYNLYQSFIMSITTPDNWGNRMNSLMGRFIQ